MKLIFVDETSDGKFKDYFGLCLTVIDSSHYSILKSGFQEILSNSKWDITQEFKGQYLFSQSKGDSSVSVEERIDICSKFIELTSSKINSRATFYYTSKRKIDNPKEEYLCMLPKLIRKALNKAKKGNGKDIVAIYLDFRSDVNNKELQKAILPVLKEKGYVLFENIALVNSCFETVGILYTDIIAFLQSKVEIITSDSDLFDLPEEMAANNNKLRKLKTSSELLDKVKNLKFSKV